MEWLTLVLLLLFALALIVVESFSSRAPACSGLRASSWPLSASGSASVHWERRPVLAVVAAFLVLAGFIIYYSLKKRAWDRFALNTKISSRVNDERRFVLNVGETGHTLSALRPAGKAEFGNHVVEVHTLGNFVDVDQPVRVVRIDHNKVFVEVAGIH
jgi:membrane-bound ClpP family serine protease